MSLRRRRTIEVVLTFLAPALILLAWEALSRSKTIDPRFWPAPSSLWETARDLVVEDDLLRDIWVSTMRITAGFLLGAIPGVALGLLMGLFWPVRVFVMPIAAAIYAIPKIAILPLVIIAFGIGEWSKIFVVAISIFFLVVLNTMTGVLTIDRLYPDVAQNFGASRTQIFLTVALPGALPSIFTGLRLALGFSLIVIVGTEFLAAKEGVGHLIWQSYQTFAIKKMYVGLVITGLMGWGMTLLLDAIERRALPWNTAR
jgi:NitT/TauT family transport system permease protein